MVVTLNIVTVEIVNRQGLAGPTSLTKTAEERPYNPIKEMPAHSDQPIVFRTSKGVIERIITADEWLDELGINNRGGT